MEHLEGCLLCWEGGAASRVVCQNLPLAARLTRDHPLRSAAACKRLLNLMFAWHRRLQPWEAEEEPRRSPGGAQAVSVNIGYSSGRPRRRQTGTTVPIGVGRGG